MLRRHLSVSDLWFCHLHVIYLLTLIESIAIEGEWLEKFNKMNWTAVTQPLKGSFKQADLFYKGHVRTKADVYETAHIFTRVGLSSTRSQWVSTRKPYLFSNHSPEWCKAGHNTNLGEMICSFKNVQIRVDSGLNPTTFVWPVTM